MNSLKKECEKKEVPISQMQDPQGPEVQKSNHLLKKSVSPKILSSPEKLNFSNIHSLSKTDSSSKSSKSKITFYTLSLILLNL